jgi:hypothetical protein
MKTKTIKLKNAAFGKMTPAQKRVAIAKDVIAAIAARQFKVRFGRYWERLDAVADGQRLGQALLCEPSTQCRVCGAGAVLLSGIRVFNKTTVPSSNWNIPERVVNKWFSKSQNALIEAAFEVQGTSCMLTDIFSHKSPSFVAARKFSKVSKSPTKRLIAIMRNIIANKGQFKP